MTAMMPLVGPVADGLVEKGMPLTKVRKLAQGIAFVGPAMCMIACGMLTPAGLGPASGAAAAAAASAAPVGLLVGLLSVSFALGAWSRAGLYCNHQDLSPKYAGKLTRPLCSCPHKLLMACIAASWWLESAVLELMMLSELRRDPKLMVLFEALTHDHEFPLCQ